MAADLWPTLRTQVYGPARRAMGTTQRLCCRLFLQHISWDNDCPTMIARTGTSQIKRQMTKASQAGGLTYLGGLR